MASFSSTCGSLRQKVRQRLSRFRSKSRDASRNTHGPKRPQGDPSLTTNQATDLEKTGAIFKEHTQNKKGDAKLVHHQSPGSKLTATGLTIGDETDILVEASDLWSAAYREAVESLCDEIDITSLEGKNVAQLLKDLEDTEKGVTQESTIMRGWKRLRDLEPALQNVKLALDLASPLAIEPTARTVVGVVSTVTAIALSFANADLDFAQQIAHMLEQMAYIDNCDTLGQKSKRKDIHKALVPVYQKILEFYKTACEILARKGAKMITTIVFEGNRLPGIVRDFLRHADILHKIVQTAVAETMHEIQLMLCDVTIGEWLGSDKMSRQVEFHAYVRDCRADQACEFLLKDTEFIQWYGGSESRQLVILGDLGRGKTVCMAFIRDELSRRSECQLPKPKICFYYCRDDETGKASSIYSGLLLSLLGELPGLKKPFVGWYQDAQQAGIHNPAADPAILEGLLQKTLEEIDRPIFFLIDGLDECNRASRKRLLGFLDASIHRCSRLKILLSSRPHEEILECINGSAQIELGYDAGRDALIVHKTVETQLHYLSPKVKALVMKELSKRAQGSAIWTKMVVEFIEVSGIRAERPMESFLEKIPVPRELTKLYSTMMSRSTKDYPENRKLAWTALKLLAVTCRPLSIRELACATTLGINQQVNSLDALAELVDHLRIMSLIQPFIAGVDFSDLEKYQLRLEHHSVKEFIMEECSMDRLDLEAFILDICIRYLLLEEIDTRNLFSEELVAIAELPQEIDLFKENGMPPEYDRNCTWETWEKDMIRFNPVERGLGDFFIYASCHWLGQWPESGHFGAATKHLPSLTSIEKLCQAGSTRFHNWIQQNCRPGCAINARVPFDSSLYDPLSITALWGSEEMLRYMLKESNFGENMFLPNPAMGAAAEILKWGELSRLDILFSDGRIGPQLHNLDFFRLVIKIWRDLNDSRRDWAVVFDLVNHLSDTLVHEGWGNELLRVAASAGCLPIIQRLMSNTRSRHDLRSELLRGPLAERESPRLGETSHQSIGEAVLENHVDVVEYLLGEDGIEAHLRYRNSRDENVLHLASTLCNPDMYRLLALRFLDGIHQVDVQGATPLLRIITNPLAKGSRNMYESARILLMQSGASQEGYSKDEEKDLLWRAVQLRDVDMCSLLVVHGNIKSLSILADSQGQNDMEGKDTRDENEANLLPGLMELFDIKSDLAMEDSLTEALRTQARKRYHSLFGA